MYAAGASQSARFLGIYYNTIAPLAHVYDGFLFAIGGSSLPPVPKWFEAMRVYTEEQRDPGALVPSDRRSCQRPVTGRRRAASTPSRGSRPDRYSVGYWSPGRHVG